MKAKILHPMLILLAGTAVTLSLTASAVDTAESKSAPSDARGDALSVVARVSTDLRNCDFNSRDAFIAIYAAGHEKIAENVAQVRANHSAAFTGPERNEAMNRLTAAGESFEQKLDEAREATSATWNAARDSVAASWDTLFSEYRNVTGDL